MALTREDNSPLFAGTVAGTLRLIFYLALAMVLMVLDHRNGWIWRIRYSMSVVVEPVYRLAGLPAAGMRTLSVAFADRKLLTEQNQRLREDLLLANAKLNRMAAVAEQNQRLELTLQPNTVAYNGVTSAKGFDFKDRTLTVEIPQATSQGGWAETYFQLQLDSGNRYTLFLDSEEAAEPTPRECEVRVLKSAVPTVVAASANGHRSPADMWRMSRALSAAEFDAVLFPTIYSYVPVFSRARKLVMVHDVIAETYPQLTVPRRTARLFWRMKTALGRFQADALIKGEIDVRRTHIGYATAA